MKKYFCKINGNIIVCDYETMRKFNLKEISEDEKNKYLEELQEFEKREQMKQEIADLKQKLFDTDYKAIKYAEGLLTLAEYESTREERKSWREKINILENSLKNV